MIKTTGSLEQRLGNVNARRAAGASRRAWSFAVALLAGGLTFIPLASANEFAAGQQALAPGDYAPAAASLFLKAEEGQPAAQTELGYLYANGYGVPQDYATAAKWLRRAADQGYPAAQFLLGVMVDKGHGVKQDFVEAEALLALAAAHANPRQRDYWTRMRDAVATKLTRAEIAEAQQRALEFQPIPER